MIDSIKAEIVEKLSLVVTGLYPDVTLQKMYGGTVFELRKNDSKSRFGGVYTYTNYVSLELSNGALFDDPKHVLEGAGKFRRHVKLHALNDIEMKNCLSFLRQAILMAA